MASLAVELSAEMLMGLSRAIAACAAAVVLAGCFLPGRYKATLGLNKDGTYAFQFDGKATHVMAAAHLAEKPASRAKIIARLVPGHAVELDESGREERVTTEEILATLRASNRLH